MRIGLFLAYWPWFSLDEQVELARDGGRAWLAFYLGAMGAKDKNFYEAAGADTLVAVPSGDKAAVVRALAEVATGAPA